MPTDQTSHRPRRSVLYMPGSNARALEKARQIPADAVIFDLEDSVAPDAKDAARAQVVQAVRDGGFGRREVVVRVNPLSSQWGAADLEAALGAGPDGILVPKVSEARDIEPFAEAIARSGARPALWAMMETPRGVLNALAIADAMVGAASPGVFVMGTNDLAKETRARLAPGRETMLPWITTCLAAARASGLDIIDGVFNALDDEAGLLAECRQGRDLGMDGKTLIHPKQVEPCNVVFSPSEEEIAWARRIAGIFDVAENRTAGVVRLDGQMVERLHAEMARRTLAIADATGPAAAS